MQIINGINGKLQEPCLLQGEELDGGRISWLFGQKIIWLRRVLDIPNIFFSEETMQSLVTDLLLVNSCYILLLDYLIKSKWEILGKIGSPERPRNSIAIEIHPCLPHVNALAILSENL